MNKDNYCVIMAGGIGSRFWPLSKHSKPKQFLDILGTGKTLLQQTYERFKKICPVENILIVTNKNYKELVLEQLPEISETCVLLEPMRKNTAPCIAYANYKIQKINPDAKIVVAPSDHLIVNEARFIELIEQSFEFVSSRNALLTLGIQPSRPETGYGYIQVEPDTMINKDNVESVNINKVKVFTEKPNFEMAKVFCESGEFYWNAGIFIWTLQSIQLAFNVYLKDIDTLFVEGMDDYNTEREEEFINRIYPKCKNISIDYGIMEKAENVYILCSDFGWSDLGSWGSLYDNSEKDAKGNVVSVENVLCYDTYNTIVNLPEHKLAVLEGLEDFIIVESDGVLLVCRKKNEQQIKQMVNDVKAKYGDDFV